jgi:hypothetical protein
VISALSKLTGTRLPASYTKNRVWVANNGQVMTGAAVALIGAHNDDNNMNTRLAPVVTPETFDTERLSYDYEETLHKRPLYTRTIISARGRNGSVNPRYVPPLDTSADESK